MKTKKHTLYHCIVLVFLSFGMMSQAYAMGLRSFVALPVEKGGSVVRFAVERTNDADTNTLISSYAYGINSTKTLLLGLPYRLSPRGSDRASDLSVLFRQNTWQKDSFASTSRLGLLIGAIVPSSKDREVAGQAGLVFTHFKNRNEFDADVLYQAGLKDRNDSARYDISWQYRVLPSEYPEWGFSTEWNTVLKLNGRWDEGREVSHQLTAGLQRVTQNWVVEGGISQDVSTDKELRYLVSTRFHF